MPARRDEIESARSEGVRFRSWVAPLAIVADERGRAAGLRVASTRAEDPRRGRRSRIVTVPGSESTLPAETIVFALGYQPILPVLRGVNTAKTGLLDADVRTGRTSRRKVWAVGDVVTGPNTVVHAMAAGRRTAREILRTLDRSGA
jgi:glutamate synthase (NADPH/NADH) small chain